MVMVVSWSSRWRLRRYMEPYGGATDRGRGETLLGWEYDGGYGGGVRLTTTLHGGRRPVLTDRQQGVLYPLYTDFETMFVEGSRLADVFKCTDKHTKEEVAVKIINIPEHQKNDGIPYSVIRQVSILKALKHPNIIRLLDVVGTVDDVYLVFECKTISLHKLLYNPMLMSFVNLQKNYLRQILSGVEYCHSHKIVHGDLRPHNILSDSTPAGHKVCLSGFGSVRTFDPPPPYPGSLGSRPSYTAPELLLGSTKYSAAIDIWSVGCMFAEMLKLKPLFNGEHQATILAQIFCLLGTPTEKTWPGLSKVCNFVKVLDPSMKPKNLKEKFPTLEDAGVDLLSKMLCLCPEHRISAKEALGHKYFQPDRR